MVITSTPSGIVNGLSSILTSVSMMVSFLFSEITSALEFSFMNSEISSPTSPIIAKRTSTGAVSPS